MSSLRTGAMPHSLWTPVPGMAFRLNKLLLTSAPDQELYLGIKGGMASLILFPKSKL